MDIMRRLANVRIAYHERMIQASKALFGMGLMSMERAVGENIVHTLKADNIHSKYISPRKTEIHIH